jgi:hypothetical protein
MFPVITITLMYDFIFTLMHTHDLGFFSLQFSTSPDIFLRDMRWCPTFSNLKTLVLDHGLCEGETSGTADCTLACILEHAPLLEKLTVIFFKVEHLNIQCYCCITH